VTEILLGPSPGYSPGAPVIPVFSPDLALVRSVVLSSGSGSIDVTRKPWVLVSVSGFTGSETEASLDELPGVDGAYLQGLGTDEAGVTMSPGEVVLEMHCDAGSPQATAVEVKRLWTMMNPRRRGNTTPRVQTTLIDGQIRSLNVIHTPAPEDFAMPRHGGPGWRVVFRAVAPDPMWRGREQVLGPFLLTSVGGGELPMDLAWDLAGAITIGTVNEIEVGGDEITHPIVTLTGPATSIRMTRGDGRGYELVAPGLGLTTGQQVVINHDDRVIIGTPDTPAQAAVIGPDGSDWGRYLLPGPDLFHFRPGIERVTFEILGLTDDSDLTIRFTERHWSGYL
jgi:hypothetical protein